MRLIKMVHVSALSATLFMANAAMAEDQYAGLEEVVVTAQKREATLQETPVAVSVVTGVDLTNKGIADIQELEIATPSLNTGQNQSTSQQTFSIRGLGTSGNNAGLEPSVGVFIDGVYRSRAASAIDDFIAVERVEILRGPQSSVYGKNTPAGVISIITKKPEQKFGLDIEQTFGDYSTKITRATVTGPINDTVSYRVSGNYNSRDGYIDNVQPGRDTVNDRDRYALRGQLLIEPNEDLSIRLIADTASITEDCCGAPFFFNLPANAARTTALGATLLPDDIYNREIKFDRALETEQENSGFSAQVDWERDNFSFTSLSAFRDFEETNDIDADFIDIELSGVLQNSADRQVFTQEFRLQSIGDNSFDWLVGYYYYDADQKTAGENRLGSFARPFFDLAIGGLVTVVEGLKGAPPGSYIGSGTGRRSEFDLLTTSHSVFGKLDWHINDRLTASLGARWTTEDKDIDANIVTDAPYSAIDFSDPASDPVVALLPPAARGAAGAVQLFRPVPNFSEDRSESEPTAELVISYDYSDDVSLYASGKRGYKAGGFNVSSGSGGADFDKEIADAWELGAKIRALDNQMQINLAAFSQRLRDFQTNAFNGTNFTLTNAGRIQVDGLEFETFWAPTENLYVSLSGTYLDAKYESYVGGPKIIVPTGSPPTPGRTQDLSGKRLSFVPKWTVSSSISYEKSFSNFNGFAHLAARYRGERNVTSEQNPIADQDSYVTANATIGISDPEGRWSVSLWGKNIFDEEFTDGIFNSVIQSGSFNAYPGDPRIYGVTLRFQH
ncbi:MAG: iron complex outermembrane receptor protein [Candidatus Azotimanducaceae bacterium]|jgi:iron complex outermembrane receptor protein